MFSIDDLCHLTAGYLEADQVAAVKRAYDFGADAHEGQLRATGEPYISHPVQVAAFSARCAWTPRRSWRPSSTTSSKTPRPPSQLATQFGKEVAELVDGVSKLTQISFESRAEAQAENFRKMMLAVSKDIRVILIKLADRLHNMRTLEALSPDANAPHRARDPGDLRAHRQPARAHKHPPGARRSRLQRALPMRYRVLAAEVRKARGHRKQVIRRIETASSDACARRSCRAR